MRQILTKSDRKLKIRRQPNLLLNKLTNIPWHLFVLVNVCRKLFLFTKLGYKYEDGFYLDAGFIESYEF